MRTRDHILKLVRDGIESGRRPTCREMSSQIGVAPSTVHLHLVRLRREGLIPPQFDHRKARAAELFERDHVNVFTVCGQTVYAIQTAIAKIAAGNYEDAVRRLQRVLDKLPEVSWYA